MSARHVRTLSALALLAALAGPAAKAQDQTWYSMEGSDIDAGDNWGRSVALLPDQNGDGHADMLIGSPDDGGEGSAYVIGGKSPHLLMKQHHGAEAGSQFGLVVAYAGLVNADTLGDYLVAAPRRDVLSGFFVLQDAGQVTLYSAGSGAVIRTFEGSSTGARFGEAIAANADVTGDGRPDILIGAPHWDSPTKTNVGYANLYNGVTGALINHIEGVNEGDLFGSSVALVGDLTGDGRSEYAIGAPSALKFGFPPLANAGSVTVYNGLTHVVVWSDYGLLEDEEFGAAICAAGDTDGDGIREVLVGAPGYYFQEGRALLYEGPEGALVRDYDGVDTFEERFGSWVSRAGDIDKDGHEELVVGATQAGTTGGGLLRVFDGEDGSLATWYQYNQPEGAAYNHSFDGGRDVNGDGWPDLLIGLPNSDLLETNGGRAECIGLLHYQPDLGFAGPHAAQFSIYGGQLAGGSVADFSLTNGPDNGAGFLMLSPSLGLSPFKGGTLVPKLATSVLVTFPFLPNGELVLPGGVPGGGGPVDFYAQFVLSGYTSGAPVGLSNCLKISLLP